LQFRPTFSRRHFLKLGGAVPLGLASTFPLFAPSALGDEAHYLAVRDKVPDPKDIFFSVQYPGKVPIRLAFLVQRRDGERARNARRSSSSCPIGGATAP
jgi:hypothetical protein